MAMLFNIDLKLYYIAESGLSKEEFNFSTEESKMKPKKVQLYIAPDGYFDTVYEKSFVKSAGICQSLVLDVKNCCL